MTASQVQAFRHLCIELSSFARGSTILDWELVAGYLGTLDDGSGFLEGPACDPIFALVRDAQQRRES